MMVALEHGVMQNVSLLTREFHLSSESLDKERSLYMHLGDKNQNCGATGYILLWLLGIPIPILLLIFLLRGCT